MTTKLFAWLIPKGSSCLLLFIWYLRSRISKQHLQLLFHVVEWFIWNRHMLEWRHLLDHGEVRYWGKWYVLLPCLYLIIRICFPKIKYYLFFCLEIRLKVDITTIFFKCFSFTKLIIFSYSSTFYSTWLHHQIYVIRSLMFCQFIPIYNVRLAAKQPKVSSSL